MDKVNLPDDILIDKVQYCRKCGFSEEQVAHMLGYSVPELRIRLNEAHMNLKNKYAAVME